MKILWITNIVFPEALGRISSTGDLKGGGGWLLAAADGLLKIPGIELAVACPSVYVDRYTVIRGKDIGYYIFPKGAGLKYNRSYESYWLKIKEDFKPDIVHIHGSEYSHGLAYVRACGSRNVVVSIQGLVSVYARYFKAGLTAGDILGNLTFRDLLKGSLFHDERMFFKRGKLEEELLRKVDHVIGRTDWDRDHVLAINPRVEYHFCNESLRGAFYEDSWARNHCVDHSIFCSQATYPIKGFHELLKAFPLILRDYPDSRIRVAGGGQVYGQSFLARLKRTGYSRYIDRLMTRLQLRDKVQFLGPLTAEQMKQEYLSANVFVCPSSIENSPNSLGEAQVLGVPVVASYVGGVPDMMAGAEDCMYRFGEVEMLAAKVCDVFRGRYDMESSVVKDRARIRHDLELNTRQLTAIYESIVSR